MSTTTDDDDGRRRMTDVEFDRLVELMPLLSDRQARIVLDMLLAARARADQGRQLPPDDSPK